MKDKKIEAEKLATGNSRLTGEVPYTFTTCDAPHLPIHVAYDLTHDTHERVTQDPSGGLPPMTRLNAFV